MRLVTFELATPLGRLRRTGAMDGTDHVIDLRLARAAQHASLGRRRADQLAEAELGVDMLEFLSGEEHAMECAREALDHVAQSGDGEYDGAAVRHTVSDVHLLAPLPRPNSLRDFLVFEEHLRNCGKVLGRGDELPPEWYNLPAHYKGNPDAIYGPEDVVPYPGYTDKLDYELEICAVVGRRGRRIKADDAGRYIAGYTLYNDWSARDIQMRESSVGIGPGIGKDMASSIGPTIATPDEFSRENSKLEARIDGETWSSGTLSGMHFSFEQIIEFISQEADVVPGDLLGSGTIGMGCGFERDRYLTPGMTIELEAEGIGLLRNTLGDQTPPALRSAIGAPT
jgi:2-keto-4-pentenoate hydratase/2-oxohepta-3-ene-1,7-dioic acid hydratase in catechol pathway